MMSRNGCRIAALLAAILLTAATATVCAQTPAPVIQTTEIGLYGGEYTGALGSSNGQFLRYRNWRPGDRTWRIDVGRNNRFDDTSMDYGLSYTRHLPSKSEVTAGISSGTGDFIANRYRIDLGLMRPFLPEENLQMSVGYTHIKSKGENYSNGLVLGANYYRGQWLFSGDIRTDFGEPGGTTSSSWGLGATWYFYERTYLGAGYRDGNASYMMVGPSDVLVDYDTESWYAGLTQYFTKTLGVNLKYDHETTPFYKYDGVTLAIFEEY